MKHIYEINKNILFLLLCCILFSCAKKRESQNANSSISTTLVHEIQSENSSEANKIAAEANLICDPQSCHPSVALFIAKRANGVATCTSSLIGDDLMVTSSHCIPKEIKTTPSLCAANIRFIFPAIDTFKEESVDCLELLGFTQIPHESNPDFAFIRLAKKMTRAPISISRSGLPLDQTVTVYKIDPITAFSAKGKMVRMQCEPAPNSLLFPNFQTENDPLVLLGGCEKSIAGNSGSPILNKNGQMISLVQAAVELKSEATKNNLLPHLDSGEQISALILATNAQCFDTEKFTNSENCPASEEISLSGFEGLNKFLQNPAAREKIEKRIVELLIPYQKNLPNHFFSWNRLARKNTQFVREVTLAPFCFHPAAASSMGTAQTSATIPVITTNLILNSYLQPKRAEVFISQENSVTYRYNPLTLKLSGESTLLSEMENNQEETTIGFCSEEFKSFL